MGYLSNSIKKKSNTKLENKMFKERLRGEIRLVE